MNVRTQFEEKLTVYHQEAIYFGTRVEEYLLECIDAFEKGDEKKARKLIKEDKSIDEMQMALEQKSIMLLALEAPVAHDLRKIITSIKIFANLERIGDYACHLAKLTIKKDRKIFSEFITPIAKMAYLGATMIRGSMSAYIDDNEMLAMETADKDKKINKQKKQIIAKLIKLNPKNNHEMRQIYRYISICKDLERLGDHIITICEWIVFSIRGEIVDFGNLISKE